ncbi:MAG TPA: PSD1 and planctomycete cytochrome C domain-containing protein [Bryobacteraceae bacterium]|nr:PSD1 and planctomycete cytochrome C domain-containing protein [Bryobacteraceae bacterium]
MNFLILLAGWATLSAAESSLSFERDILPIFTANCFNCHGGGSLIGLDLRTAQSTLQGSHQGSVVVKGSPEQSRLYQKVSSRTMPPPAFKLKLTDTEIETIKRWIAEGAPHTEIKNENLQAATEQFDKLLKPLLNERCAGCHGTGKPMAGLDLRTLSSVRAGSKNGPVVVEGEADKSPLLRRTLNGSMPPKGSGKPLDQAQIETLRQWIDSARFGSGATHTNLREQFSEAEAPEITAKDRAFWAFQPPVKRAVPMRGNKELVRNPIDAFVLAKLEPKGLSLSPAASDAELLRRAYLDLIGLPPTPDEIKLFTSDTQPRAYERMIDRLLESKQYGIRWGRHWLDSAGYTDTTGQETIFEGIWRYRDYVVESFNEDKPYDRFLVEQIAGDELVDWRSATKYSPEILKPLIATGYLRSTFDRTDADITNLPQERYDVLIDLVDKVSNGLLGLSVGCARCHTHKFDPIPQRDYYRMMAVFSSAYNPWNWTTPQERFLPSVSKADREEIDRHNAELERPIADLKKQLARLRAPYEERVLDAKLMLLPEAIRVDTKLAVQTPKDKRDTVQQFLAKKFGASLEVKPAEIDSALNPEDKKVNTRLNQEITTLNGYKRSYDKIQALWDTGPPPSMRLLQRGVLASPGPKVTPGFLAVLSPPGKTDTVRPQDAQGETSGQRLAFARWLTSREHPLTARVMVNRVWQHHFGKGIVQTPDNFGRMGAPPPHPELLDWLAVDFMENGWSLKRLHRQIMVSATYRQRSRQTPEGNAVDPDNALLWRMNLLRLESETIRDSMLAVSGKLDLTMGGPAILLKPRPDGLQEISDENTAPASRFRRSLYIEARRGYPLTFLEVFDSPLMQGSCNRRSNSATPLQSLTLLNDDFIVNAAEAMAERLAPAKTPAQIELAYELALSRKPTAEEVNACNRHMREQTQVFIDANVSPEQAASKALASLCQILLSTNEFLYRN